MARQADDSPAPPVNPDKSSLGSRRAPDSSDGAARTVAESCSAAPGPGLLLIRRVRLTTVRTAVQPQQPDYLSHSDAAAAPVDCFPQRQTLMVGHRPQSLPGAPLSAPDESITFTKRGQHGDRQPFESAFPVGPFFAQYRLGI